MKDSLGVSQRRDMTSDDGNYMETIRKKNDSETDKNGAIIAEQWEHKASICRSNGVDELAVTEMTHSNRTA